MERTKLAHALALDALKAQIDKTLLESWQKHNTEALKNLKMQIEQYILSNRWEYNKEAIKILYLYALKGLKITVSVDTNVYLFTSSGKSICTLFALEKI
jgi:NAD+--asparagine ADP-ribosyltransferase